jgi:hypothetical protein
MKVLKGNYKKDIESAKYITAYDLFIAISPFYKILIFFSIQSCLIDMFCIVYTVSLSVVLTLIKKATVDKEGE